MVMCAVEYVTCHMCRNPETSLTRDSVTRLYFIQCESCGSRRSVAPIKSGFHAHTRADRRALKKYALHRISPSCVVGQSPHCVCICVCISVLILIVNKRFSASRSSRFPFGRSLRTLRFLCFKFDRPRLILTLQRA